MEQRKIKDPSIAKKPYKNRAQLKEKISYKKWIEFIEDNQGYFTWLEDTDKGKKTLLNMDKIPESFREGVLKGHNKVQACAEFGEKKGYYEIIIEFIDKYGTISTTFMKPMKDEHIRMLLDMANYLDAYLLNNGIEVIDESYLKSLT